MTTPPVVTIRLSTDDAALVLSRLMVGTAKAKAERDRVLYGEHTPRTQGSFREIHERAERAERVFREAYQHAREAKQ